MKSKIYIFCFVILSCLILRINNYAWEQKYGLHWHDRVEEIKSVKVMKAEGNFFGSYNEYELVVEFKYIVPDSQSKTGDGLSHETFYLTIKLTYYPNTGEVIERVQEVYYPPGTLSVPFVTGSHKAMSAADPLLYGGPFATTSVEGNIYETRHDGHYEYKVAKMHFLTVLHFPNELEQQLRLQYKEWTIPPMAPVINLPKENSTHSNPNNIKIKASMTEWMTWPCDQWNFTMVLDRWDKSQGASGGWTSAPHSYETFLGQKGGNICRGETTINLKPAKYRIRVQVQHARRKGLKSTWSNWIPFEVNPILKESPKGIEDMKMITLTKPNGGEQYFIGDRINMQWTSLGIKRVRVVLIKGAIKNIGTLQFGRNAWNISPSTGLTNTGQYRYTIPNDIKPGVDYRIGVISTDQDLSRKGAPRDISDNYFTISMKAKRK